MIKHYRIKISGKVQGVYFRASTQAKAEALGVKGSVRNEKDGSVFIEAEAEEDQLNLFVEWCHRGPERAKVQECVVEEATVKNFPNFLILR
jgi:acylphosphatase